MKTKLQVCIIDEKDDGIFISSLLKKEFPEFEINFQTNNIENASIYLNKTIPDVLFLNIKLVDEKAIKIFSKIRQNLSHIIFTIDSEKEAIPAIKRGISDYLLKPIKNLDFVIVVSKILTNIYKKQYFPYRNSFQNKINIPTLQGFKRVSIDEIIRCEADSNYTFIYLLDKTKIVVPKTLYEFEKYFSDHNFFRIHHKHLINLEHLKEYIKGKGGQVIMTDDTILDVSARKRSIFLHTLESTD